MPRGRKKKTVENVDYATKIEALKAEIEALTIDLKNKKAELKKLVKEEAKYNAQEAERKAAEEKEEIVAAVSKSGKSLAEVLAFLKG